MKRSPVYSLQPTEAERPPERSVSLQRGPAGIVMLTTVGKLASAYVVKEIPAHNMGGRGFQLTKLFGGSDAECTGYAVFIAGDGKHQCHCRGWLGHHHCTHVDGLAALIEQGQLPPQLTPTPVIPVPAPRPMPAPLPPAPPHIVRFAEKTI